MMIDLDLFRKEIEPLLIGYEIKHKFFEEGDFGSLHQVEFNTEERGGEIDFWSKGWLSIHFVDYIKGEEKINVLLEPHEEEKKKEAFHLLQLNVTSK